MACEQEITKCDADSCESTGPFGVLRKNKKAEREGTMQGFLEWIKVPEEEVFILKIMCACVWGYILFIGKKQVG